MQAYLPTKKDVPTMGGANATGTAGSTTATDPAMDLLTTVPEGVDPGLIGSYRGISEFKIYTTVRGSTLVSIVYIFGIVLGTWGVIDSHFLPWLIVVGIGFFNLLLSASECYPYYRVRLRTKCARWQARYWISNNELREQCVRPPRTKAEMTFLIREACARDQLASHPAALREIFRTYTDYYHDYDLAGRIPTLNEFNTFLHSLEPPKEEPT